MNTPKQQTSDLWWVDHLENDLAPSQREDLELLLQNSGSERRRLTELQMLRKLIKDSEENLVTEDGLVFERMHQQIMAQIQCEPVPKKQPLGIVKKRLSGLLGSSFFVLMIAVLVLQIVRTSSFQAGKGEQTDSAVQADSEIATQVRNTLVAFQSEPDFLEDAAVKKLNQLDPQAVEDLLKQLK